jgi:hypothetical protein
VIAHDMQSIEGKLRQAWQRQRRYVHLRGASRFLIWLVAMIVVDFVIDWGIFFQVRMTTRLGLLLLGVNVVVLGYVLWHEWLRHLKPFDPLRVSLDVEAQHPELSSRLVSYTQFSDAAKNDPHVSRELIEATRTEAVIRTSKLNFGEIINFAQLKKLFVVAGCVMLLFAVMGAVNHGHLQTLLKRLAGLDASYPTRTQIVDVTGDIKVRIGDTVSVIAEAAGVIPDGGNIFIKPVDGESGWKTLPLERIGDGSTFERELKEVVKDHVYYVKIGDDQSARHHVRVVTAPQIVSAKVNLKYPSYLEKEAGQVESLSLEVPKGTTIDWQLSCDKPVKRLLVKTQRESAEDTIEAEIDPAGTSATFSMLADQPFKYTFEWTERESGNDFEYDDVQHQVRVVVDKAPEVKLVWPKSDGLATVHKTARVVATATDDHGLAEAWLVYTIGDSSKESRLPIHDFAGARKQEFNFAWELKKSIQDLKPGVQIKLAVEVADRSPDAAEHRRRSATRKLTVVELEKYLAWHQAELTAQLEEIKRVRDREAASSTEVKQLKEQESPKAVQDSRKNGPTAQEQAGDA